MFIFNCSVASFYNSFNYSYWSLAGCVGGCLNSGWCGCVCLNHWNNKCMLSSLYVPGPQVIWWVTTGNQRRYVCVYPDCLPVNISLKIISLSPLSALRLSGWWSSVVTAHTQLTTLLSASSSPLTRNNVRPSSARHLNHFIMQLTIYYSSETSLFINRMQSPSILW